ncbi:glycosyltransferase family 2 protein [Streptomyces sp. TRM49041]|uniref:glycosyltransferase family 2 protein n=1 Tax=Streptomyces sp. TRM49041 TaxID=2603216 RepID=UPI0011EEA617|nr:glycosyltransferase family 2 protein [Streptomyces sp. TRM49041]
MPQNTPDVTVVIGAYDAMPYLVKCLESAEAQTIGRERMEIVAVDDGSTDGTGEYLEKFAARTHVPMRVVRQANSGGPGGPRNTGLRLARGRYVFFLDADDYLGEQALQRLVAMADRAGTDVVLGRTVGVNRNAATSMWGRTVERADIFTSNVKYTLSAQKLFRRELLVRYGMRFDESLRTGEDALFTLEAYLRGSGVSVVADYVCYYLVGREDGKHVTRTGGYAPRFDSAKALMELIARHVPKGRRRDLLILRPFAVTLLPQFGSVLLRQSDQVLRHKMELAAPLMAAYWTPGVARRLKPEARLRLTCVALNKPDVLRDVVAFLKAGTPPRHTRRLGRRYAAYPHFRDPSTGIPDTAYELREQAWPRTLPRRAARRLLRAARHTRDRTLRRLSPLIPRRG